MKENEKKEKRSYAKRDASEFNFWRAVFYALVTKVFYMIRLKVIYRMKVFGKENIPKHNKYVVAANHLSTLDPPMLGTVMPRPVSFMAKQELFDIKFIRWWLDWLGAFAVNRDHLGASTIKTAKSISQTEWVLGLFPQGTRCAPGTISNINKGFASIAKSTKCGILPVGITGTEKATHIPFSGNVVVRIGELIPYNEDVDVMVTQWIKAIEELTGFKYVESEEIQNAK